MLKTLYLGKLSGIQIYIHWTFWLLVIYLFVRDLGNGFESAIGSVVFVFMIFACVFLHELGHAFSGRWFNVKTQDITLYPIGGVARMQLTNPTPLAELVIAACGPLVNLVIAAVVGLTALTRMSLESPGDLAKMSFLEQLFMVNIALFLFNLLPVYPMDGGRILRACLGFFVKRESAVEWSARIGQVLAAFLALYGLFTLQLTFMIIFGIMFFVCSAELFQSRLRKAVMQGNGNWQSGGFNNPYSPAYPVEPGPSSSSLNDGDVIDAENVREVR